MEEECLTLENIQKDAKEQLEKTTNDVHKKENDVHVLKASVDTVNSQIEQQARKIETFQKMREQLQNTLQQAQINATNNEKEMRKAEQLYKEFLKKQVRSKLETEFTVVKLKGITKLSEGKIAQ